MSNLTHDYETEIHGRPVVLCLRVEYVYRPAFPGRWDEPPHNAFCEVDSVSVLTVQESDGEDWTPGPDEEAKILNLVDWNQLARVCLAVVERQRTETVAEQMMEDW